MWVRSTTTDGARTRSLGRLLIITLIATLIATLALHGQREMPARAAANFPNGFKSIGYQPSWAGDVAALPYSKLTHVNYSFLGYNADGSLRAIDNAAKLQQLVNLAHQNGVKVFIAIGGWTGDSYDDVFEQLAANATARNNFVNNVRNFVNQYNLDGVDIDWEYPTIAANYTALMQGLSGFLRPAGKGLTTAVVSDGSAANAITSSAYPYIDWINIMAYDGGSPHANYDWAIASWSYWRNTKGVPANKLVLGVPFYSRPGQRAYRDFVTQNPANADVDCVAGDCYNGRPTIRRKTQYVMSQGGGGIMYWDTSHDTTGSLVQYSLISAIYEAAMGSAPQPTRTNTSASNPTPIPGNIALGKPATASSSENTSLTPNLAVDGNSGTRWASAFSDPQWIRVDLGNTYNISRVRLNWEAAYATAYQIQVSNDGTNFTTIRSLTGQNGGVDDNTGLAGSGRYVRIYGTTRATQWGYSLFDFEVYGTLGTGPTATSTGPTATRTRTATPGGTNPTATRTRTPTTSTGTTTWAPNTFYAVGAVVSYSGVSYRCLQAHTAQVGWEPPTTPALWQRI